jgi:hypothetical protein
MSTSSHFLNKAPKSTAFSGLHAWIKTLVLILAVVASLGGMKPIIASAAGTTYYVDKTNGSCSDTANPGTSSALPFCTITKGATVARFGDTVRVIAGSYTEKVTPNYSGTPGNPITYSAVSGVSVNGGATTTDAFHLSGVSYITIDGFTINAPTQYGIYMTTGSNLIVSGNQITGTTSHWRRDIP